MHGTREGFDSLPWHDAYLQELVVDRRNPGIRDEVRLKVSWPEGPAGEVVFSDCYAMTTDWNFGVIADEQIASASISENDPVLPAVQTRWQALGVSLEALRCYRIETASTASVIRIYAKSFEVK